MFSEILNRKTFVASLALAVVVSAGLFGPGLPRVAVGASGTFLDQTKVVSPRMEWNREVTSRGGGTFDFLVTSRGPVAITVVTDKGYRAMMRRDMASFSSSDMLMTVDSPGGEYEGTVTIPPGSSWFIIENQTDDEARIRLECYVGG